MGQTVIPTIFRYIVREYLKVFALTVGTFLLLFQVFDFIERFDYYFRYGPAAADVFKLIGLKTLPALTISIPVAVLLSSVLTLAVFNRNNELVAMRASGIGFLRIAHPLAWCGLIASLAVLSLNELVLPSVNEKIRYLELIKVRKNESLTFFKRDQVWFKDGQRVYNIDLFLPTEKLMRGVTLYELNAAFQPVKRLYSPEAKLIDGKWKFSQVTVADLGQNSKVTMAAAIPFRYGLESLSVLEKRPEEMSFKELRSFIRRLRKEGLRTESFETDLHARIAFGLVSLLMALVGIPFSTRPARQGGAMTAIALATLVGFSYWILFSFGLTLGRNGLLPPMAAAWLPNATFAGLAIFFFRKLG